MDDAALMCVATASQTARNSRTRSSIDSRLLVQILHERQTSTYSITNHGVPSSAPGVVQTGRWTGDSAARACAARWRTAASRGREPGVAQELDGDPGSGGRHVRQVDDARSALAEQPDDAVGTEDGGFECWRWGVARGTRDAELRSNGRRGATFRGLILIRASPSRRRSSIAVVAALRLQEGISCRPAREGQRPHGTSDWSRSQRADVQHAGFRRVSRRCPPSLPAAAQRPARPWRRTSPVAPWFRKAPATQRSREYPDRRNRALDNLRLPRADAGASVIGAT